MRRNNWLTASAATMGLMGGLSGMAHAQNDYNADNVAVRAGVSLPFDTALSNYGNPLIDLGAEYTISHAFLPGGDTYFSVDYIATNLSFGGGVYPICVNERWYFKNQSKVGRRVYGFLGIGAAIIDIGPSNAVIAGRGGLGTDLGPNIFFEIDGTLSDRGSTARADTVGFSLGYRF